MSQMEIIRKASLMRISDFNDDASLYCNTYQAALDQVCGMLQPDSILNQQSTEGLLQGFMLANVTEAYKPLVATLQENWTATNTDLAKACLSIERYNFITRIDATTGKALLTTGTGKNPNRAPKDTCDFDACVQAGLTTHYKDKCWKKYPHLRLKYSLRKMKTKKRLLQMKTNPHQI